MSEYRELRQRYSLLDICRTPDLATAVTLQPVRRIEVDAAILFSDLLLPLEPMGIPFDFVKGEGPSIETPLRSESDLAAVRRFEPREALAHVLVAIQQIQRELRGRVPLIGFAGAPFTLASYAIEGGHSNSFAHTKSLMYGYPAAWHSFCDLLADVVGDYLAAQIEAGVDAVQIFDSWVGVLNAQDYREFILPHTRRIFARIAPLGVPTIHFGVGTGAILPEIREAGGDVIGADWRTPLGEAWSGSGSIARCRATSIRRFCSGPSIASSRRSTKCSRGQPAEPATSSISGTASCRRLRSSTSRPSPGTCINRRGNRIATSCSLRATRCHSLARSEQREASSI